MAKAGSGSTYDISQGVRWAAGLPNDSGTVAANPADIINLSLGGPSFSTADSTLYQELFDAGVIVVAAAGNENTSQPSFPAAYDGVFSVSALDAENERAPYSNFGSEIDIAAPGGNASVDATGDGQPDGVLSTLVDDSSGERQSTLSFSQGTSMAAPHVAGMFALMKAVYPELTASDVETLLQAGSLTNDIGISGRDDDFGHGAADAFKAVQAALALENGGSTPRLKPCDERDTLIAKPRLGRDFNDHHSGKYRRGRPDFN